MSEHLSEKERKVLAFMSRAADTPLPQLARETGYREGVVRNVIAGLKERSVMQESLVVDELKLGLHKYDLLISVSPPSVEHLPAIEQKLVGAEQVLWITKLTGNYDYYLSVSVNNPTELGALFDSWRDEMGNVFARKAVSRYLGWAYLGPRYLLDTALPDIRISTGFCAGNRQYDATDLRIISVLSRTPSMPLREVARAVDVPPSTLNYRISRLRKHGHIQRSILRLQAPRAILRYKVMLKFRCPSENLWKRIYAYAHASRYIVEIARALGDWDVEFRVEVPDVDCARLIVKELESRFGEELEPAQLFPECGHLKWQSDPAQYLLERVQERAAA